MIQGIKLCIQEALEDMKKVLKIPMGSLSKSKKDLITFVKWNNSIITRLLVKWTNAIIWLPHRLLKMISEELKLVKQWWIMDL